VFIAGMTGSGKSYQAWHTYLARFQRRLILDWTGEWEQYADVTVYSLEELVFALKRFARAGKWTVCIQLSRRAEVEGLVQYLIPLGERESSPIYQAGGAVFLNDEVDVMAPPRSLQEWVRDFYRRSRHVGLSIVSLTQRPEAVSREVSSQSDQAVALRLRERGAYEYMEGLTSVELMQRLPAWTAQHPHGGVWWDLRTGEERWFHEGPGGSGTRWVQAPRALATAPVAPVRRPAEGRTVPPEPSAPASSAPSGSVSEPGEESED